MNTVCTPYQHLSIAGSQTATVRGDCLLAGQALNQFLTAAAYAEWLTARFFGRVWLQGRQQQNRFEATTGDSLAAVQVFV